MSATLPSLVGAGFADIAAAIGFAGANLTGTVLGEALSRLMRARAESARSILLSDISKGLRSPKDPGEIDEFVAIIYRYMRAAQEGTAHLNLMLMARVVRSQIEREGLYASEFLRYADLIASLSREEVILLGSRARIRREYDLSKQHATWSDTKHVNGLVEKALIPSVFATQLEMQAALAAIQRTGLIWPAAMEPAGGPIWQDTPLLDRIVALAEFESVLDAVDSVT
jgi:hypothetical protein